MRGIRGDVAEAVAHLEKASVAVDRLWNATADIRPDQAIFGLGEASLAIHRALLALGEWDGSVDLDPWDPATPAVAP